MYYVENDSKILKSLITYLPADIYDLLSIAIEGVRENLGTIYKLTEKVFLLRL